MTVSRFISNKLNRLADLRRKWLSEMFGSRRLTMKARDNLDILLAERLPKSGVYIEAGALDGYDFSNTYFLDRFHGWSGLLVEPNPLQFNECKRFRKRAIVTHCALVPFDFTESTVKITYGHDLTWTEGAYGGDELREREKLLRRNALSGEEIDVPARTVQSLINEHNLDVTFFSLDVEGFEASVLRGLDLSQSAPKFLLIECHNEERYSEVRELLSEYYDDGEKLTRHDYFFSLK